MIGIDNHGFSIQENKLAVRTHVGFPRLKEVVSHIQHEYTRLRNHAIDPNQMKAKRVIEQARKREVLELLSEEKERLLFSVEDVHSRMYEFYDAVAEEQTFVQRFLQEYEMRLVYPKSKWTLKVAKFTLRILDDLHEVGDESSLEYVARELENKAMNICQTSVRNILNFQPLVWDTTVKRYLDATMSPTKPDTCPSIAFRYYALQFLLIYTEYMAKFRVKQRRLDIYELLDARYLGLLLPILKHALVRFTDHLRPSTGPLSCPTRLSIIADEGEAERELEERVLLPLSVQCLRNVLDLMQYLPELPAVIQSILVEHVVNAVFDPSAPPATSFTSADTAEQKKANLVGKKDVKEEVPVPAAAFAFNQFHLFHDVICLLCHHGGIHRRSAPSELSDAAVVPSPVSSKPPSSSGRKKSPGRARSAKGSQCSLTRSHALSAAPARASHMFFHPSHRPFVLGAGRRSLLHTSILPDLLRCAIYFHTIATQVLPSLRASFPIPISAQLRKKLNIRKSQQGKPSAEVIVAPDDLETQRHSASSLMSAWETAVLPLAFRAIQRSLVILGRPGHVGSLVPRDTCYLQHVDDVIVQATDATTLFYQQHPQYPQALAHRLGWALVQSIHHVCYHRLSAIFVQLAFAKLLFATALPMYHFQTSALADPIREALAKATLEAITPVAPNSRAAAPGSVLTAAAKSGPANDPLGGAYMSPNMEIKANMQVYRDAVQRFPEELLREELLVMTQRVLAAFAVHHKQSLAMTRMCCITLRLLFREIFVKRTQVEDLLSMNLTSMCAPFTASLAKLAVIRDEGGDEDDEEDEQEGAAAKDAMALLAETLPSSPIAKPTFMAAAADDGEDDDGEASSVGSQRSAQSRLAAKASALPKQRRAAGAAVPQHSVSFALDAGSRDNGDDDLSAFSADDGHSFAADDDGDADGGLAPDATRATRLGGVLEEEEPEDGDEDDDGDGDHDDADRGKGVAARLLRGNDPPEAKGSVDGGDSLTTVSRHGLPPPSKHNKAPPKRAAGKPPAKKPPVHDGPQTSMSTTSASDMDLGQLQSASTLKSTLSTTFSVDHYTPVKLFKHLPNPLVPKTLLEHAAHASPFAPSAEEKKDEKKDKAADHASVGSDTTATSYTATVSANATEGQLMEKQKQSMMKNAQKVLAKNAAASGASNAAVTYVTLADILMSSAETHLSHAETFEQILLLVEHVASKSYLCKYVLVETGLPLILQRYLQSQPANVYMVALTQLCLEALEI